MLVLRSVEYYGVLGITECWVLRSVGHYGVLGITECWVIRSVGITEC